MMNTAANVLFVAALVTAPPSAVAQTAPVNAAKEAPVVQQSFLGVRVLKTESAGHLDWSVVLPAQCTDCRLVINELTSAQNAKEFYFHFFAPPELDTIHGVRVSVDPSKVRGVLAGHARIPYRKVKTGIVFDVPRHAREDLVAELHTQIETPGVNLRVEHADEQRRRGPYAAGRWPSLERQAALNLEFAAREAIESLGLSRTAVERNLGVIQLMGFDTNYPTLAADLAHDDYPPHWHMHVYWILEPKIRTVDHIYIGPDGLLTYNKVIKSKLADPRQKTGRFERGETCDILSPYGDVLFTQTITSQGYFMLGASSGKCLLSPTGVGFHAGVAIVCDNGLPPRRIRAEDDLTAGRLRLFVNDRLADQYDYDRDTAKLKTRRHYVRDSLQ